jgi:F0F1-type ATP synthase assembly protein I
MAKDPHQTSRKYLKYSSLGFEMMGFMLVGFFIGQALDNYFNTSKAYFTAGLIILFLAGAFYRLIKQLEKDRKNGS